MTSDPAYGERERRAAQAAIERGHKDPTNLRELLIWTTSRTTAATIDAYFAAHLYDPELLDALISIALEGDDAGDAPWAAANTLAMFPAPMLMRYRSQLVELSEHPWVYLSRPAKAALSKLDE